MVKRDHFEVSQKNQVGCPVQSGLRNPKNGLGFKIGPRQQKCHRTPNLQPTLNPAVAVPGQTIVIFAKIEKFDFSL